jgi:large subunit ribosomal protein L4
MTDMSTTVQIYGADGSAKGSAELPAELFEQPVHEHLMWLSVKRHLGNQRQGTASVKTRGEVSGGGKKPWRQKGTGRARSGSKPRRRCGRAAVARSVPSRVTTAPSCRASSVARRCCRRCRCARARTPCRCSTLSFDAPKTSQMASVLKSIGSPWQEDAARRRLRTRRICGGRAAICGNLRTTLAIG